ncbi:hypothetical protein E1286_17035 [Nonomuraea terrae]|uniref:LPXTG cell wall anchor domain-containing protein n=1 Tax=Nonomuraea terrae TaxID=2530383 RepID=A0A4R4YVF6_9ACTN|nr:hypothetical protein [Nonomuraea terrae]TDD47632.1 hypothetical protein E1286_17035 [Nonomuraea terrae]
MLKSQAWRRRARKTSALGLMSTLVVFVCSVFLTATPASAAATRQYTYSCTAGGPFTNTSIVVGLSAPDTATAGQSFNLTVNIPTLTLATAPTTTPPGNVQVTLELAPTTGATVSDEAAKSGAPLTVNERTVQAGSVTYPVQVAAGTTADVGLTPGALTLGLPGTAGGATETNCTTTTPQALEVPIGTGNGNGDGDETDIVAYNCVLQPTGTTDANYPAEVDIRVVMTPPTSASPNQDASVTWTGTIQNTGDSLTLPTGFPTTSAKTFVTVKASGAGAPATVTGEGNLASVTAGSDLTTLPSVTLKVRPTTTGTVTLTAGDITFGATTTGTATSPVIKCTAPTTGLKEYKVTVGNGTGSPSPSPTTTSPRPTRTATATVTITPSSSTTTRKSQTPVAGADTGAGGMMGPDGRMFILTGTALITAAAVGGLVMRRRSIRS